MKEKKEKIELVKNFLIQAIKPKSDNEDIRRREFILNVLLVGSIIFSTSILFVYIFFYIKLVILGNHANEGIAPLSLIIFTLLFWALYFLSRKGYSTLTAYFLIFIYFIPTTSSFLEWGADLPQSVLTYAFIVVLSGILINTQFAFLITFTCSAILVVLNYLQVNFIFFPDTYWRHTNVAIYDSIVFAITFFLIFLISWLYNREIEKSLTRARESEKRALASEAALQKERDGLEITVQERTQELKEAHQKRLEEQDKRISQLDTFCQFGRSSSAVFHDLTKLLNNFSLEIDYLRSLTDKDFAEMQEILDDAKKTKNQIIKFTQAAEKQLLGQNEKELFYPSNEINDFFLIIKNKTLKINVELKLESSESESQKIQIYGNKFSFCRIIANLVNNAFDAYEKNPDLAKREIIVSLQQRDKNILIEIQDFAGGIPQENLAKIFDDFYTTKESMGLGLGHTRELIEKDFNGRIEVKSQAEAGTTFSLIIPINNN